MYKNLPEMLDSSCHKYWWRKVVLSEDNTVRYYKLRRRVDQLTNALINKFDLKPQDKVVVLLSNSSLYPVIYFSILKAGAVVIPLNVFLKGEELKYIIDQCGARILIAESKFCPVIEEIRSHLKELNRIILVDKKEDVPGYTSLNTLTRNVSARVPKIDILPESVAVIIYTSGTTGYPKGAMLTHKNLLSNIESCLVVSRIRCRDRVLLVLPMFHSFTMTVCMLMPIAIGAGMVIIRSLHPFKKVFRKVLLQGVTIIVGIPPLYALLAKAEIPRLIRKLLRIRLCISGAAPLPEDTLRKFEQNWKLPLLEGYGLSESSPVVSLNPLDGTRKAGSVGLSIPGVKVKIVGPDEAELAGGSVGEIIIRGDNVMKGYYNNVEATKETIRGNWLFTGDMGRIDEDGYIYIVNRKKDMILVRGLNVYPREIEQVLGEHPDVSEVSVVGKPDSSRGEVPVAFIIPNEGRKLNHAKIIKYCRERLADYKVPHHIIVKEDLPRTPTGKILKRELRNMAQEMVEVH